MLKIKFLSIFWLIESKVMSKCNKQKASKALQDGKGQWSLQLTSAWGRKVHQRLLQFREAANDAMLFPALEKRVHQHLVSGKGKKIIRGRGEGEESQGEWLPIKHTLLFNYLIIYFPEGRLCIYDPPRRVKALSAKRLLSKATWGAPAGAAAPSRTTESAPAPRAAFWSAGRTRGMGKNE